MIWHTRYLLVSLLLAGVCTRAIYSQDETDSESQLQQMNDNDATIPEQIQDDVSEENSAAPKAEQTPVVGQSILLNPALGAGPLHFLGMFFPALFSLLNWGNGFPTQALLGTTPDQQAAASKVVLVLAEDRNTAASQVAAKRRAAGRTVRQDPYTEAVNTFAQGRTNEQMVGQSFGGSGSGDVGQGLGQMLSQGLNMNTLPNLMNQLTQSLLAQLLNQNRVGAAPASTSEGEATDTGTSEGTDSGPATTTTTNPVQQLMSQMLSPDSTLGQALSRSPLSGSDSMLEQIFNPQTLTGPDSLLGQAFNLPGLGGDGGMLGSSLQLPSLTGQDSSLGQIPPDQIMHSLAQSLTQSLGQPFRGDTDMLGMMFRGAPTAPSTAEAPAAEAQASEISEVRVKPDNMQMTAPDADKQQPISATDKMSELKLRAALQTALREKSLPLLWFHNLGSTAAKPRMDSVRDTSENKQIENKLAAFERQVIAELKQLQEIERQAREMREAAKGLLAKNPKDSVYKLNYPLSKTPVHKITREDLEKALSDEYVRKLLQKAATRLTKPENLYVKPVSATPSKRQATTMSGGAGNAQSNPISKEDMVKMLAYAYRMATTNGQQMSAMGGNPNREQNFAKQPIAMPSSSSAEASSDRQWLAAKQSANDEILSSVRQSVSDRQKSQLLALMQRQWAEHQLEQQQHQQQKHMTEQRQWVEKKMQKPGQKGDEERKSFQAINDAAQSQEQRQWVEPNQRQGGDLQSMVQQMATIGEQQKDNWNQNEPRQWIEQQTQPQSPSPQIMDNEQRQWIESPPEQQLQEQQFQQAPIPLQREWMDMKTPQPIDLADGRSWIEEQQQQMPAKTGPSPVVGEAVPQIAEDAEKARKGLFDDLDFLEMGGKSGKKHKGGKERPTVINYYYTMPASHSYGGAPAQGYNGYGGYGGYSGGHMQQGYGGGHVGYGSMSGNYGGGGYGSNAYGGHSNYRTATGSDDIEAMLREHQTISVPNFRA